MPIINLRYHLISGFVKSLSFLPLPVLYILSSFISFTLHRIVRYRVDVVRKNIHSVFPQKTENECSIIESKFYKNLVDIFIETIKLSHITDKEIIERVQIEGINLVNEALKRDKSVVVMMGHFGNWEWVTTSAMQMNKDAVICEIYHPLGDKAFDRLMLKLRSRFGTENIPMGKAVRRLLEINREGGKFVCGFISDQRPFTEELKHWTEFCGLDTPYVNGGEVIGKRVGAEFIYVEMLPLKRGKYKMTFSKLEPIDDGQENPYTRAFLKRLEESIQQNPPYWLWSHNRWKRKRTLLKEEE